jgi:hypothetical protein
LEKNFDKALEKIKNIRTFWERFKLSLPGRINVAKTLMLPQISYVGAILTPSIEQTNQLQKEMDSFVSGGLKISKNLISVPVKKGGLGMINIDEFITGLHCSWIKRAHSYTIDNWRLNLKK